MVSEGKGNGAGARADVYDAWLRKARGKLEDLLDDVLGFRPRNQHVARNAKRQPVELRFAGDVLDWLATVAPFEQLGIAAALNAGELLIRVGHQPGLVLAQHVQQQRLGIEPRPRRMRTLGEQVPGLGE